jgi:hypothetical protein
VERIVRGRSATLTKVFSTAPSGTPTVAVTRVSDGTVVTVGGVTGATDTWSYTIPASSNTLLDTYTETWTATVGGTAQSFIDHIEVAGDVLFTLAEARAVKPLEVTGTYTDAKIQDMRTLVEQAFEAALGYALVPRFKLEMFTPDGGAALWSRVPLVGNVPGTGIPFVTSVRSAVIDGTAITAADVIPDTIGFVYDNGWGSVRRSVVLGFEHGAQYPPERIRRAALFEARYRLIQANSPTDDRAVRLDTEQGSYALQQPGRGGQHMYLPESDACCQDYGLNAGVA